jgi:peptide/nickel transport system substrate-binding protein
MIHWREVVAVGPLRAVMIAGTVIILTCAPALRAGAATRGNAAASTLVVVIGYEPASLDPAVDYDTGGNTYLANVYDGLVRAAGTNKVKTVPDLARGWNVSRNGKTWTFHLRPGVKFHDGSTVNAQAVKFSFDRMLKAKQGAYPDYAEIQSISVLNPLTVQFHLKYSFASFLPSLTNIDAAEIVSPKTVGNHKISATGASYLNDHDAGSGPYMLASYQHHQKIVLKRFPGYWRGWHGPHANTVVIEWPSSSSTQRLELERGGIDATMNLTAQDFSAVSHESGIHVVEHTGQTIRDIRLNTAKGAMQNRLVRQALNDAFDYNGVIQGVFQGAAARMRGVGPTGLKNFVPVSHPYTFDLAKAQGLLKQSGVPKKQLNFTIAYLPDDTQAIQMAQIFQSDLKKIGVTTKLQGIPIATYVQVVKSPSTDPDIWIGAWTMDYNDDAQMYYSYYYSKNVPPSGGNVMFYKDPVTDRLLNKGLHATSGGAAYRYYRQVVNRVYAAAPNIWPVQPKERIAVRNNVHGYSYNFLYSAYYYPLYTMYRS